MITISIDPVLVALGPLAIRWYGLMMALGILAGIFVAIKAAKKSGGEVSEDDVYNIALWAVPGGIIGARLAHVIDRWDYYMTTPLSILAFQEGGMAIWGAILGGVATAAIYVKVKGLPVGAVADAGAFALLAGQIVGRIGCTINGDAWGSPTGLPWGIVYTHPGAFAPLGVAGHPWPIYEMIWNAITFGVLWSFLKEGGRAKPQGLLFLGYAVSYSLGRFFLTFLRQEREIIFGLQEAHIISLLVLAVALPALIYLARRGEPTQRGRLREVRR